MINGDIKVSLKGNELLIQVIKNFSSNLWADKWGKIEDKINQGSYSGNIFNSIRISFAECTWADPFPLLSMLMLLINAKSKKDVIIVLPFQNPGGTNNYEKGRFLKFLASQGFLKIMIENFRVFSEKNYRIKDVDLKKYANYKIESVYKDAEILCAQIYDANKIFNIKEFAHKLQNEISIKLKSVTSLNVYYSISTQLYNILIELIENVSTHAYAEDEQKLFGIYIRKRCGIINNDEQKYKDIYSTLYFEKNNCPALGTDILINSESVLEIFLIDRGIGISGSLIDSLKLQNYTYPVRELFFRVLKDGERSKKSKALTAFGGLHFITRVIRENKGYIWCKDSNEWIGAFCSDIVNDNREKVDYVISNTKKQPAGLGWCIRLPYTDDSDKVYTKSYYWEDKADRHPVYLEYKKREDNFKTDYIVILDEWERNNQSKVLPGDVNECINSKEYSIGKTKGKYKNFIWRPNEGNSKNQIIDLLNKYIDEVVIKIADKFEDIYLYIIDIDRSEILNYFYAFDELNIEKLKSYDIVQITLITKQWGVTCFTKEANMLLYNDVVSANYVCSSEENSIDISSGLSQMANFLRKYDSWIFWKKIENMQDERIFINAEIEWTSQKKITSYLDLDRLYLYEDLYNILKDVLARLSGLEKNRMAELCSIDVATSRICRELNTSLIYRENRKKFVMNIGGVCASGYTKESFYGEQKVDMTFVFFAHPSFNKEFKDTAYLLIWPHKDFFRNFKNDPGYYKRMGQTNLISVNQRESLINVENIYSNSMRNKRQVYEDLQQKYPKFVKYGHFQTDRHHYLIGIDVNSYMQYSYIKREGAFLFLLAKILFYLADSESTLKDYIENLADTSWNKVLNNCDYSMYHDKGEVVVYHSNTYTEYCMKLIKKIIPTTLLLRIIPINFLNVQSKGTPIAFSPFILERIKEHYMTGQKGILYIDSSLYTGRSLVELENILLSAGCGEVHFASFLDMRRLRNADKKSQSYWKLNIPRLDNKSQCVICNTLNVIKQMESKLDLAARERIQEWIKNWQFIDITNNVKDHGIESDDDYSADFDNIKINSIIGLNVYITEHMCETFDDDFVYKYIQKEADLTPETKMQLISTQLCLFGNQNSRQLQLSLLSELVGNMAKSVKGSSYTSLAGLMLISQSKTTIYELLNEILILNKDERILSIKKYFLESQNIDLAIVIGYFIKMDNNIEALLSPYSDEDGLIALANKNFLPDKDLKLVCKQLLGLCVNEQSNSHNTSIEKLKVEHVTTISDFRKCCTAAQKDLQSIKELARHFPLSLSSNFIPDRFSYQRLVKDIDETERLMKLDVEALERNDVLEEQIKISDVLKANIEKFKNDLNVLLYSFFISSSDETKSYFENLCKRYENIHKKKVVFKFCRLNLKYPKWYYWNNGMEKEFGYFLDNLKHCEKKYGTLDDGTDYYMEVTANFDVNHLTLIIKSWSKKPSLAVEEKFLEDNRLSKEHAAAFDVNFGFCNAINKPAEEEYLLETKMEVPSCYQTLRERS